MSGNLQRLSPYTRRVASRTKGNFRPISILSTLSKILEKHVHIAFYDFIKRFNLIRLAQSGFRNLLSCETPLLNIVNKWTKAIDDDNMVGVLLLDLHKAFDLIDHDMLLHKLKVCKCCDHTVKWFTSYLKGRTQCTVLKGKMSVIIKTEVPQGSILGPLFILFINDLPLVLDKSDVDIYAVLWLVFT